MQLERTILSVVEEMYAAAEDGRRWVTVLQRCAAAVGSGVGGLYAHDLAHGDASIAVAIGTDASYLSSYEQYYNTRDPWANRAYRLNLYQPGEILTGDMVMPTSELIKTEHYSDWLAPQHIRHAANVCISKEEKLVANMVIMRSSREFADEDLQFLRAVTPHLQRAVRLHQALAFSDAMRRSFGEVADGAQMGVILLDARGAVLHLNSEAARMVQLKDGLGIADGRLVPAALRARQALNALVADALRAGKDPASSGGGSVCVERPSGALPFHVLVSPMRSSDRFLMQRRAVATILITDPTTQRTLDPVQLRAVYGLTEAELGVARGIAAGQSPKRIASLLGVSVNTVKTHLKSLFSKTDSHRQADLVRKLL